MLQKNIKTFLGENYFVHNFPICITRSVESFDTNMHFHDFLEICYVGEGKGIHISEGNIDKVSKGDLFMVPLGVSHVFRPISTDTKEPLIIYNFIINIEAVRGFLRHYPGGNEVSMLFNLKEWKRYHDNNGEYYELFQRMHYEYSSNLPGREATLYNGLMQLLLFFYYRETRLYSESTKTVVHMQKALEFIHSNYKEPIQVKDLASIVGVGERQFQRLFLTQTGMNFKDYLQGVRITEACRLLIQSDRKVVDIASAVGYNDLPFFNKLFKQKTGFSPREYRSYQ